MKPLIHIGMPKTATTTLQKDIFTDESIFYPIGRYGAGGDSCRTDGIRELIHEGLFLDSRNWKKRENTYLEEVRAQLDFAEQSGRMPVLSNEGISMPGFFGSDLDSVFSRLLSLFGDAQIAVSIRNQRSVLKSFYSSAVVDMGASISFQEFILLNKSIPTHKLNISKHLHFDHLMETCDKYFSSINLVVFEEMEGNPELYLNRLLGAKVGAENVKQNITNASRDEETIRWARALNRFSPRGIGVPIETIDYDFNSKIFRKIYEKVTNKVPVSKAEADIFNYVMGSRKQQMVTMHRKEALIEICQTLRLTPEAANDYSIDEAWLKSCFGVGNMKIAQEYQIDLKSLEYPLSEE